jgi:hypothetical protein
MDRQRNRSRQAERGRKPKRAPLPEPILIVARRPGAPAPTRRRPRRAGEGMGLAAEPAEAVAVPAAKPATTPPPRRSSRIVQADPSAGDETELERRKLLTRLLGSEGSGAVTRAALAYREAGFEFPREQSVQLKLLEHQDEQQVCAAMELLAEILDAEPPIQVPVFEQRLRRIEEVADDPLVRDRARDLRRALRS